ncbi:MAG: baseplate J/gp47 family protein [Candidatus Andersenbacteria bacterium]
MPVEVVLPVKTLVLLLIAGITAVGGSLAYVYLPRATITLRPATSIKEAEQTIILSTAAKEPDFVRYILPAKLVEQEVTQKQLFQRSGSEAATTEDFARGIITLTNKQSEEQNLLPKTHLRHEANGVFFLTDAAVKIPPQSEVQVSITAKEKGSSGNVPAGSFIVDKLPTSLQTAVYGTSSQAFSGGLVTERALTEEEISAAKENILVAAKQQATGELTLKAGGAQIREDLITASVLSENISAEPGSRTTEYSIETTVRARGFVVDDKDMLSLTLLKLRSNIPSDEEFISYEPDSFQLSVDKADFERGEIRVIGKLTGLFARKISPSTLRAASIAGLSQKEAQTHFEQMPDVGTAEVRFWPFWVTTTPARPQAVEMMVENIHAKP